MSRWSGCVNCASFFSSCRFDWIWSASSLRARVRAARETSVGPPSQGQPAAFPGTCHHPAPTLTSSCVVRSLVPDPRHDRCPASRRGTEAWGGKGCKFPSHVSCSPSSLVETPSPSLEAHPTTSTFAQMASRTALTRLVAAAVQGSGAVAWSGAMPAWQMRRSMR